MILMKVSQAAVLTAGPQVLFIQWACCELS